MRRVVFDPDTLTGEARTRWDAWQQKAVEATNCCLEDMRAHGEHVFRTRVWTELKEFLLKYVFNGKCGYCETDTQAGFFGDADHYRPKGRVTVLQNGKRIILEHENRRHTGYYWLAYDWRNIIPACQRCNSAQGKVDQFPVAKSHTFPPPDGAFPDWDTLEAAEQPLLLHPYRDDPNKHLRFGSKGTVAARDESPVGDESIRVYDLQREELQRRRQEAQESAWDALQLALVRSPDPLRALRPWDSGVAPYSTAAMQFVRRKWRALRNSLAALDHAA